MTHARYAFIKVDWELGFASRSLVGFVPSIPERDSAVFDLGRSALHHDAGGRLAAGLNARSL